MVEGIILNVVGKLHKSDAKLMSIVCRVLQGADEVIGFWRSPHMLGW